MNTVCCCEANTVDFSKKLKSMIISHAKEEHEDIKVKTIHKICKEGYWGHRKDNRATVMDREQFIILNIFGNNFLLSLISLILCKILMKLGKKAIKK